MRAAYEYAQVEDMSGTCKESVAKIRLFILLDNIEDPHNLGAIIRTANLAGAHGVIIPKRQGGRTDCDGGENIRGSTELYAGGQV